MARQGAREVAEIRPTRRTLHVADLFIGRGELTLQGGIAAARRGQGVEILEGVLDHPLADGGGSGKRGNRVVVVEQDGVGECADLVEALAPRCGACRAVITVAEIKVTSTSAADAMPQGCRWTNLPAR